MELLYIVVIVIVLSGLLAAIGKLLKNAYRFVFGKRTGHTDIRDKARKERRRHRLK